MPRSVGRIAHLTCSTCNTTIMVTWWHAGDELSQASEWNEQTLSESKCECDTPHWSIPSSTATATVTHHSNGKTVVVYQLPDGDYTAPGTNERDDPMAVSMRDVGIRREFSSLRELRSFQKEQRDRQREIWQRQIDEGLYEGTGLEPSFQQLEQALYEKARNQVLEYTEESLRVGNDRIREKMTEERERNEKPNRRFRESMERSGFRVGRKADNERYERMRGRR